MFGISRHPALARTLLQLTWPTLVAQAAVMAYGIVDTVMAGRISALDLAAVGIGASIYATLFISLMGVMFALTPIVAHHVGAGRIEAIGSDVRQSLWLALAISALGLVLLHHPEPLLWLTNLAPDTELRVRAYLSAVSWGVPAVLLFRVFFSFSVGIGRPRPVMVFNLLGLALKIGLNAVLMFGMAGVPALGAAGAGLATALSMWALALASWAWCRHEPTYAGYRVFARWEWPRAAAIGEQLRLGVPICGAFLVDVSAFTLMALFIARFGAESSAAHQIAASIAIFAFIVPISLGHASSVLVGQALGARDRPLAEAAARLGAGIAFGWGAALAAIIWLGAPYVAAAFTTDLAVQAVATPLVTLVALFQWGDAVQGVVAQILRGYKRTVAAMVILLVPMWGVGLGGGWWLAFVGPGGTPLGARGYWIAESVGMALAALGMWLWFRRVARA